MANKKELKRRIRSVKNIGQITKALQMVSAVKMRKAQEMYESSIPYFQMMETMFTDLVSDIGLDEIDMAWHRKPQKKEKKDIALVIITPSKGFAGSLLFNLVKKSLQFIEQSSETNFEEQGEFIVIHDEEIKGNTEEPMNVKLITVEKKSKDFVLHLKREVIADIPKLASPPVFSEVNPLAQIIVDEYKKGNLDSVYVLHAHFLTTFSQQAVIKKVLPLKTIKPEVEGKNGRRWYTYGTDELTTFQDFFPVYIDTLLYHAILDATASEHAARMIAMKNATDNASDLGKALAFEYNQKRQAAITQEIAEITSSSEAI